MISLAFWFWPALAVAYLLLVAFVFSALFAWWAESARRKAEAKSDEQRLREQLAARQVARHHHVRRCICGLIGDTRLVHIDIRCIQWTRKVELVAARLRLAKLRHQLEVAQKKKAGAVTPAKDSVPVH